VAVTAALASVGALAGVGAFLVDVYLY